MKISELTCDFDGPILPELLKSIREHGILVPIFVSKEGKVLAGKRRFLAAKQLGLEEIPAEVVKEADFLGSSSHTPMSKEDTARMVKKCLETMTVKELASKINKSERTIRRWRSGK